MENPTEDQGTHNDPGEASEKVEIDQAELEALKKKAEASEQNFSRLKKEEDRRKELEAKLAESGESSAFDPAALEKRVEEKVGLRLAGLEPEQIAEIEKYAKGAGISLSEAAQSPFVQKAVEALKAEKKSQENTPAPSSKVVMFNGKPVDEVFKTGTDAEKQAAWETLLAKKAKNNE